MGSRGGGGGGGGANRDEIIEHFYQYEQYQQPFLSVLLLILPLYNSLHFIFPQKCKIVLYFLHFLGLGSR